MGGQGLDRRKFIAGAGGAAFLTLAGSQAAFGGDEHHGGQSHHGGHEELDLEQMAARLERPPHGPRASAAAGPLDGLIGGQPAPGGGIVREYWIRAERVRWTIVPTRRDEMMDARVPGRTTFTAFVYRAYEKDFAKALGPGAMPGPTLRAEVGDTIVVNFENRLKVPASMHPHGVKYTPEMDGAYAGKHTLPGGFVQPGERFRYVWDCPEESVGAWPYHEHGPLTPAPIYKGLFGAIVVSRKGDPKPDVEHVLFAHTLAPPTTGLRKSFSCFNGRALQGNTPELRAKVGQRVVQHVFGMDDSFHTYHLHGHRWKNDAGRVVDNETFGPGDSLTIEFVEDNPGRWTYHCHVFSHLHNGMSGWYVVDP